jgi:hypothetical protein
MKKLIASLFTALCMTVALVAVSGGAPASAAPYTGTVKTTTVVKVSPTATVGKKTVIKPIVKAGSTSPKGAVRITVKRADKVVTTFRASYSKALSFGFKPADAGKYRIVVTFKPSKNSIWKPSAATAVVRAS